MESVSFIYMLDEMKTDFEQRQFFLYGFTTAPEEKKWDKKNFFF